MHSNNGFTLTELIILLVIVGLFFAMTFLRGGVQKESAGVNDVVMTHKELTAAIKTFKRQYHYLPGDLPNAGKLIENLPEVCRIPTFTNKIGNGLIDTANEIQCVPEELKLAGVYNAHLSVDGLHVLNIRNGNKLTVLAAAIAHVPNIATAPLLPQNVIEVDNLLCEAARAVDLLLDDGNLGTGNVQAAPAYVNCAPGSVVPYLDIAY
jgi:hypothetical protein